MDLDAIRADLEQVVRESEATIAVLEAEEAEDEEHVGDHDHNSEDNASEITEADREDALIEAALVHKKEAEAALARLAAGTYGICVDCGQPIAEERLLFRPEAARCLADQERFEEREG
ncbi:MAG: conjugal transfer protein TraR [Frankiales bacterium]|nr:conjugal transfer protein TraR [Frankiales bacterium]